MVRCGRRRTGLSGYIQVARVLPSGDLDSWQTVPRDVIQQLLIGATIWAQHENRDVELSPPEALQRGGLLSRYTRLPLSNILFWALTGVFTEEERQALISGR